MTKEEALRLALEALENHCGNYKLDDAGCERWNKAVAAIKEALAPTSTQCEVQPEQEPVAWKLVPRDPTDEMLKAMDECSTEGYDERLCAGHAASVYMAAWDEAPTPPQPEQEPWMYRIWNDKDAQWRLTDDCSWPAEPIYTTPPEPRNFCPRCGKRTADLTVIHTCTPPEGGHQ